MNPLWTARAIATACGGTASADFTVQGVAFDSREVTPCTVKSALAVPPVAAAMARAVQSGFMPPPRARRSHRRRG